MLFLVAKCVLGVYYKTMKTTTNRARNGKYAYQGNWDRLCKCGRTLGVHDAEAPHPFGDYSLDERDLPECEGFKPARVKK